jgi:hypothetical protein
MSLINELIKQADAGSFPNREILKRFSPAEIRETIQSLVASEQIQLASALGDAGLSIYPQSEDMLAISSLLAMMNQDWQLAVELMDELIAIQGNNTPAFTYVMMVRALRCNLDPARALEFARRGLAIYPDQLELQAEKLSLDEFDSSLMPTSSSSYGSSINISTQSRLNELKTLLDQKLISREEYENKRKRIIDDI